MHTHSQIVLQKVRLIDLPVRRRTALCREGHVKATAAGRPLASHDMKRPCLGMKRWRHNCVIKSFAAASQQQQPHDTAAALTKGPWHEKKARRAFGARSPVSIRSETGWSLRGRQWSEKGAHGLNPEGGSFRGRAKAFSSCNGTSQRNRRFDESSRSPFYAITAFKG